MRLPEQINRIFLLLALGMGMVLHGQIKIGDNPQNIDAASVLELESSSRVLVITRVTDVQMNGITPLLGAMVYNTDAQCVHFYDGTQWLNLCTVSNISLVDNGDNTYTFTDSDGATTDIINTTNTSLTIVNDSLVLTDSNNNTVRTALDDINTQTFSTNAVLNPIETISIEQTGNNFNFEVTQITGENIVNGTVNGTLDIQAGSITSTQLQDDAVGPGKIADNAVGSLEIIDGDILPVDIAPGGFSQVLRTNAAGTDVEWATLDFSSITGQDLTADDASITVSNGMGTTLLNTGIAVTDGGIDNAKLGADAVTSDKIQDGAINTVDLANDAVDNSKLADNAVQTENILDGAVQTGDIADDNITNAKIADDAVQVENILNGASSQVLRTNAAGTDVEWATLDASSFAGQDLTAGDGSITVNAGIGATLIDTNVSVSPDGITNDKVADNAINTENITDGQVQNVDLADNAVTNVKMADNSINTAELVNDAVTTVKILDANVTDAKLDKTNIPLSGFGPATANVSLGNFQINNLTDPTLNQDAATKVYVDNAVGGLGGALVSTDTGNSISVGSDSGAFYDDSALQTSITTNASNIATNTTNIATNTAGVAANVTSITGNTTNITANTAGIVNNAANITTNTTNITANTAGVAANLASIGTNTANIATNTGNITTNTGNITTNSTNITTNTTNITANTAGVAANLISIGTNTTNIATNVTNIAGNTTAIAGNTTNITANTTNITTNTGNITTNTANIATNTTNITANTAGVAANLASIGTNTTNIATNTGNITTNTTNISTNTGNITTNSTNIAANTGNITTNANAITALNTLQNGFIYLGDATNTAQEVAISGDATMNNTGVLTIADDAVTAAKIDVGVAGTGLTQNVATGALEVDPTTITGDGNITSTDITVTGGTGAAFNNVNLEIAAGAVGTTELATNAVTTLKILDNNVTPDKISEGTDGQVLTTVGTTVAWANPASSFHALGKMNQDVITNGSNIGTVNDLGTGNYQVVFTANAGSADYVVQLTLFGAGAGATIEVTSQTATNFTVQISDSTPAPLDAAWFFTVTDF